MKAKKKYVIKVTAKDIESGKREQSGFCPVALALRRTFREARVWKDELWLGSNRSIPTPRAAASFIERFDDGKKVKPMSFVVTI